MSEKVLNTEIPLHGGIGGIASDENGTYINAKGEDETNYVGVKNPAKTNEDNSDAVTVTIGGKEYSLYGEHNKHLIEAFGYMKMASGSYTGNGKSGESFPTVIEMPNFKPKVFLIQCDDHFAQSGSYNNIVMFPCIVDSGYAFVEFRAGSSGDLYRKPLGVTWNDGTSKLSINAQTNGANDAYAQMNASDVSYHWIALG